MNIYQRRHIDVSQTWKRLRLSTVIYFLFLRRIVTEIVVLKIFESSQRKSRSGLHSVVDLFSKEILPLIFSYNSPKFES